MRIEIIEYGSKDYEDAKKLRNEVLRIPLKLQLSEKDVAGEERQIHIAVRDEVGKIVGTLIIEPLKSGHFNFRAMAIEPSLQKSGYGRALFKEGERIAREHGLTTAWFDARVHVLDFYKKLGYECVGDIFIKSTIPHIKMTKNL
jgi:predicted GNAT family N-acyltransferase